MVLFCHPMGLVLVTLFDGLIVGGPLIKLFLFSC